MAEYPKHVDGIPHLAPTTIIATFPVGTFLESIAVRPNGTILVSDMLGGRLFYVNPQAPDPQSTVRTLHDFNTETGPDGDTPVGAYGSNNVAEAIVEDPVDPDVFYTFSGVHGKAGTWAVWRVDLRGIDPETSSQSVPVEKVADVPWAVWLNGGTLLPETSTLLMADSLLGQLLSYDVHSKGGRVGVWLEDKHLGKVTDRPSWPGVNGVQYFKGHVFAISSDRAILVRAQVDPKTGKYVQGSLTILAESLAGDDLAFDAEGSAYVATNPCQTVLKFPGIAFKGDATGDGRLRVLGGLDVAETAGPTAVAFGRTASDNHSIYVTTTGGIVNPVGERPGPARVVRADVGVQGDM